MLRLSLTLLFLLTIFPLKAQDNLPPCTTEQAETARVAIVNSSFIGGYGDAGKLIDDTNLASDTNQDAYLAFDALQKEWWTTVVPALPNCDQAQRLGMLGGRMLDEMLIVLSVGHWSSVSSSVPLSTSLADHRTEWNALQKDFVTLVEEVGALARGNSTTAPVFASAGAGDSRTNPVPFGQRQHVSARKFDGAIVLTRFTDNANRDVFAISNANEPAPNGKHYVIVELTFTCERSPSESCEYSRIDLSLVGDKGTSYPYDSAPHLRGFINDKEFFGGSEVSLSVAFVVDDDDAHFLLFTQYGDPRVFFATS